MTTSNFHYDYLTRKQVNVIYSAYKKGNVNMTKKQISAMYDLVNERERTVEENKHYLEFSDACNYICNNNYDFAQARIDGLTIKDVVVGYKKHYNRFLKDYVDSPIYEKQIIK